MENRTNTSGTTLSKDPRIDSPQVKVVYPAVENTPTATPQTAPVTVAQEQTAPVITKPAYEPVVVPLTTYVLPKGETVTYVQRQAVVTEDQTQKASQTVTVWDSLKQNLGTVIVVLALAFALGYYVSKPKI